MNLSPRRTPAFFFAAVLALCLTCTAFILPGAKAQARNPQNATPYTMDSNITPLTLRHWQDSTEASRYSFLIGFASMLELEKSWQGRHNSGALLPFKQSLVGAWSTGLSGLSLHQIYRNITEYAASNPQELDRPLVDYMWYTFAQPGLDSALR